MPAAGGPATVRVRTTATCVWTATSGVSWVSVSNVSGTGEADVHLIVAENFLPTPRSATLTIATRSFQISQAAAQEIEVQDEIANLTGSCPTLRFRAANFTVTTDAETAFTKGKCSDLRNGREVKVSGYKQPNGTLAAVRVELKK
jgi:hypothetical protein